MENLLDRVGDDCRDCFGEEWQSSRCGEGSSGGMAESWEAAKVLESEVREMKGGGRSLVHRANDVALR